MALGFSYRNICQQELHAPTINRFVNAAVLSWLTGSENSRFGMICNIALYFIQGLQTE